MLKKKKKQQQQQQRFLFNLQLKASCTLRSDWLFNKKEGKKQKKNKKDIEAIHFLQKAVFKTGNISHQCHSMAEYILDSLWL